DRRRRDRNAPSVLADGRFAARLIGARRTHRCRLQADPRLIAALKRRPARPYDAAGLSEPGIRQERARCPAVDWAQAVRLPDIARCAIVDDRAIAVRAGCAWRRGPGENGLARGRTQRELVNDDAIFDPNFL